MTSPARSILTWIGRLFLLAVPVIVLCGLYRPQAVQVLDRVVCDDGLVLDAEANDPDTPFDNRSICQSSTTIVDSTGRLLAVAGVSFVLAVGTYSLRSRITPPRLAAPDSQHHS